MILHLLPNVFLKQYDFDNHIYRTSIVQASQQIMELQEAAQINTGLQPASISRESSLHDMKAIVKTWRFARTSCSCTVFWMVKLDISNS